MGYKFVELLSKIFDVSVAWTIVDVNNVELLSFPLSYHINSKQSESLEKNLKSEIKVWELILNCIYECLVYFLANSFEKFHRRVFYAFAFEIESFLWL